MAPTVVVPYVWGMLSPVTACMAVNSGWPHEFAELDADDEGGYGRLVRRLWLSQDDTIICEQDVEPTGAQITELACCQHDWCGFNYDDGLYPDGPMFGLVKLSGRLKVRHPMAAEVALVIGKRRDIEAEWWRVDALMARDLMIRGERWTPHTSRVHHVHAGAPSGPP
jgi:hypothetical protein